MKVLFQLALNNIRKYKRESFLVIVSTIVTISLITIVSVITSSVYASVVSEVEKTDPFNAHVSRVFDAEKFIDEIGKDNLVYYEIQNRDIPYMINFKDTNFAENPMSVTNKIKFSTNNDSQSTVKQISLISEGRESKNIHELVVWKGSNYKIGDEVTLTKIDDVNDKIQSTVVGIVEKGETYYTDKAVLNEIYGEDSFGLEVSLIFRDGVKRIDEIISNASHHGVVSRDSDVSYNADYNFLKGFQNSPGSTAKTFMLLGIALILIVDLMTFTLILNAFDTLFTQKNQTFSVLRSVGTTKTQMRLLIMLEGFVIVAVGIIIGILLGTIISKWLIHYIVTIIDSVVALEYGVSQEIELIYFFPVKLIFGILFMSLCIVFVALSIKIRNIYKHSTVETSSRLKVKRKKDTLIHKNIIYRIASINNKSMNSFKGIKIALTTITVLLIVLNSWLSLALSSNGLTASKYNTLIRGDCYTKCDTENEVLQIVETIKKIQAVKSTLVYFESGDLLLDYEKHDMANVDVTFNPTHTNGFDLIVMGVDELNSIKQDNHLNEEVKTIFVNKIESFDFETGKQNPVSNALDIKDGEMLHIIDNSVPDILKYNDIEIDVVVDQLNKGNSFVSHHPALLIMSEETFKSSDLINIELNQPRIAIEGDFLVDDVKQLNEVLEALNLKTMIYVSSDYEKLYISDIVEQSTKTLSIIVLSYMGFVILINIINITLTNYRIRKKYIAVFRSIGASLKQVKRMLFIESFISVMRSWIIGVVIGNILSFIVYTIYTSNLILVNIPKYTIDLFSNGITFILVIITLIIIRITVLTETSKMNIIEDVKSY